MDLHSHHTFWPTEAGILGTYPRLKRDETCQVAVIGAGITGALVAYHLAREGISCVVVDEHDAGAASTSGSTALLQYEIDTPLHELIELRGRDPAVRAYQLCSEAIDKIGKLAGEMDFPCEFSKVPSLLFASKADDLEMLSREYDERKRHGLDVSLLSRDDLAEKFSFSPPGGLWTEQAAQVNPYRFTHALLRKSAQAGARIYDRTPVKEYEPHSRGITLTTGAGWKIEAERAVFATGYVTPDFLKEKIVQLNSTYALITEPVEEFSGWHRRCLIWETAKPYTYMRTTPQGRIIIGGEDESFKNVTARDALIPRKEKKLMERFREMFPQLDVVPEYTWAGTFGETDDGLGYIGETPEYPRGYFALGYGGNGITYSLIAAEIIRDLYLKRPNPDAEIFRFGR